MVFIFKADLLKVLYDFSHLSHTIMREALSKDIRMSFKKMYKIDSKSIGQEREA